MPSRPLTLLLSAALPGAVAVAQQVVLGAIQAQPTGERLQEEEGRTVELFESPNLDRYLRKAQDFMRREDYAQAIQVLQDVVEGRTLEAMAATAGEAAEQPAASAGDQAERAPPPEAPKPAAPAPAAGPAADADPARTVFSQDGRIYRPVRRLCHELLATMPLVGLELYRSRYEALAQELLDEASLSGSEVLLEAVSNRYFVTLAAGRAMHLLGDRLMHQGRYRAAVQVLRDLVEVYPRANLARLGINPLWCKFKIALSMHLAGETWAAREFATAMAASWPDESLRVMGELHPVRDLAQSPLLAGPAAPVRLPSGRQHCSWLASPAVRLVPLWQYRYRTPNAYAGVQQKAQGRNVIFFGEGVSSSASPPATKYGTGTQIAFVGGASPQSTAVFLDHFRLRVADAFSGILQLEGDGEDKAPPAQENRPRLRVPVYDFALQKVVEDDDSYFAVLGFERSSQNVEVLRVNHLVAYDKATGKRRWSSENFREGDDSYRDVTFLTAPTVFGERLLVSVLRRGAYSLQAVDRLTGQPLWCTRLHAGGTTYFKAPGTPVLVHGSVAYVLTNAGAFAAIDAFTGDLRWIRKYERRHPLRERPVVRKTTRRDNVFMGQGMQFVEQDLPSFLPSEIVVGDGMLIFAPCDGNVVLCVDQATGEPVWMIDGNSRHAGIGQIQYIVGANSRFVYFASESDLLCVERDSGVRQWSRNLPLGSSGLTRWRGRGVVLDDFVLMPGDREILVLDATGKGDWQRLSLPAFGVGETPLGGPNNILLDGPWVAIAYAGGLEVYSSVEALLELAAATADTSIKAAMLVQSGHFEAAMGVLEERLSAPIAAPEERRRLAEQLVALGRELALADPERGVAHLARVHPFVQDRTVLMLWHLARLELFKQQQDLRAHEQEQQRLYRLMEGKD